MCILSLTLAGCSSQSKTEKVYPFPFDTAQIEFQMKGDQEGTAIQYIKGDKIATETHAKTKAGKIDQLLMTLEGDMYQIDLNQKKGTLVDNSIYQKLKDMSAEKRMEEIKNSFLNTGTGDKKFEKKGEKEIAGQKCELYENSGAEVCLWNGISIYAGIKIPAANIDFSVEASKIELNKSIPDEKFKIPEGIEIDDQRAKKSSEDKNK